MGNCIFKEPIKILNMTNKFSEGQQAEWVDFDSRNGRGFLFQDSFRQQVLEALSWRVKWPVHKADYTQSSIKI
jgi:hypothetical protein